ncbi:MAG: preprotein translocase subunit SecA [Candidatus Magasanikbacteria bacterium]|nr:preprotein translocase subunit SecA [Candidatus Magasanikbacteria bacterium]
MSFLTKLFGDPNVKVISEIQPIIEKINGFEPGLLELSEVELKAKTPELKERLAKGETLDDILPEAFATVREVARRVTGMRHFDVQLIGGVALHRGTISEMRTGEGKTLVATLPAYLNALSGQGVHVVTVNDYLAKRDAVWMGQIYDYLGLSVGIIQNLLVSYKYQAQQFVIPSEPRGDEESLSQPTDGQRSLTPAKGIRDDKAESENDEEKAGMYKVEYDHLEKCSRQDAYKCDIVYGTNNEFGFDYLRDNMVGDLAEMSQRGLNYAIVDEVDSILIDESRTPLIISAPAEKATEMYYKYAELVERLLENEDFNIDEKMRASTLTAGGIKKMEGWLGVGNIYAEGGMATVHHVEQALRAKALFKRDRDYVIENGEVIIVDEFTGRKMPGRRYSEGLHQAIEAKENVPIQRESQTMATITFQNYFRMYSKLSGMTGTAVTEAEEFGKIYKLEVVVIPTHRANKRFDRPDRIYKTEDAKNKAIAKEVREFQAKGQPVLIGTISVEKNERLSLYLEQEGIKHEILNAKNHEREGEIIAQAGRPGAVTLATNMAGRGVDIILGGNPVEAGEARKAKEAGGLFVLGTERHESRRIDNQLRGRAARQGDPGETQFYLSTEDDLMRIFAGERIKNVMNTLKVPDDMPIEQRTITRIIESAQKKVEGFHFDTRKHLLEYDDVINRHRQVIYGKRRAVLEAFAQKNLSTLRSMIFEMIDQEIEQVVSFHTNAEDARDWDMKEIAETAATIFPLAEAEKNTLLLFSRPDQQKLQDVEERTKIIEYLSQLANTKYDDLLVKKVPHPEMMLEIEKQILLRSIDNLWVEHLVAIDYLRTGIGLRGYGQRDPLVEYKKETYRMFNELLSLIQKEVVYTIYKVSLGIDLAPSVMQQRNLILQGASDSDIGGAFGPGASNSGEGSGAKIVYSSAKPKTPTGEDIGRNDPCYCGAKHPDGRPKKFKQCHGG